MKDIKKICGLVCALVLLFLTAVPAAAAQTEEGTYTYTIRFYSGKQGTIGGSEVIVADGLKYGDQVTFRRSMVTLKDGNKYYVRGIRKSGEDNGESEPLEAMSFSVTQDQDYVVAYGILGDAVPYTIHYVNENGDTLAPSETYYGNVGDKPVIAYLYIDGYRPRAYNLTKTLSKNSAENVFTFTYYRESAGGGGAGGGAAGTGGGGTTVTVIEPGTATAGGAAAAGGAGGGAAAAGEAAAGAEAGQELVDIPDEEIPATEDLVDLDDEEVPLAQPPALFGMDGNADLLGIPLPVILISGAVLLGGGICFFLASRKRRKQEE